MIKKEVKKYFIFASLLLFIYIAYLIVKPFISALIASFILAYLFYPLYRRLNKIIPNRVFNASITLIIILLLILVPLTLVASNLVMESINLYKSGIVSEFTQFLSSFTDTEYINLLLSRNYESFISVVESYARDFLRSIPSKILDLLIIIFATFTLFLSGETFIKKIKNLIPVSKKDELMNHLGDTTFAIVYGLFFTAIVIFLISVLGLSILGVKPILMLSLIMGLLVLVPLLGPAIVWVPLAFIYFIRGNIFAVVGLVVLGIILSLTENILRAKLIGDRTKLNPLIVLIGILGGVKLLGIIGFVAGPLILSTMILIIKEYYPELENEA